MRSRAILERAMSSSISGDRVMYSRRRWASTSDRSPWRRMKVSRGVCMLANRRSHVGDGVGKFEVARMPERFVLGGFEQRCAVVPAGGGDIARADHPETDALRPSREQVARVL